MSFNFLLKRYLAELTFLYQSQEIRAIFFRLSEYFYKIDRLKLAIDPQKKVPDERLYKALSDLKTGKPWQYITGQTSFYGLQFLVNEHTLIPRPETEELVAWVIKDWCCQGAISLLDIGTGSGAIAVSLAKNMPNAQVSALDFSDKALQVAKKNALHYKQNIDFIHKDILTVDNCTTSFDVIISNPPYVRMSEQSLMADNVLKYEPASALFVPDSQALIFYEKIINLAINNSSKVVYFEINEFLKPDLETLLKTFTLKTYIFQKDLFGKWRMLKIIL